MRQPGSGATVHNRSAVTSALIFSAVLAVAVLGSCTPRQQTLISPTASVIVNGDTTNVSVVKCDQLEWYRTIDIGGEFAGAKVVIDQRKEPIIAESVHIKNLGGFTGMYSQGDGGSADMSLSGDRYTITGSVTGFKTDKPGEPASAAYKIVARC